MARARPDDLARRLEGGLAPIYLIGGEEPGVVARPPLEAQICALDHLDHVAAGDTREDLVSVGHRGHHAVAHGEQAGTRTLDDVAVADQQALGRTGLLGGLSVQHVGEQRHSLHVAALPAQVVLGDGGDAVDVGTGG